MGEKLVDVVIAVQGIRETIDRYWDELGAEDLGLVRYALGKVEGELFDVLEELEDEEGRKGALFTVL